MPRLSQDRVPSYRFHRQSGQAVVTLDGHDFLLGKHGSAESRREYNRLTAEWLANGRQLPAATLHGGLTVNELILQYWRYAKGYYIKNGRPTSELHAIRSALNPLRELYGATLAREFRPLALAALRQKMIEIGWSRGTINDQIARVKRLFRWAVSRELVPLDLHHGLCTLEGLRKGRTPARETPPVQPVPHEHMMAVIRTLSPSLAALLQMQEQLGSQNGQNEDLARRMVKLAAAVPDESPVAAMIAVERLTGMRPAELVALRRDQLDMSGPVWIYRPVEHKTEHFGHVRSVSLGPRAQQILRPFFTADPADPLFSPKRAMAARRQRMREARKTPLQPSQVDRSKKGARRRPGEQYNTEAYRRAIAYACKKANVSPWSPNRLRHSCGTDLRRQFGIEAARVVLGHNSVETTQIYAERDERAAADIMAKVG